MSDPVVLTGEEVIPFSDGFRPVPNTLASKVSYTETGLVFRDILTWDEWISLGLSLRTLERSIHWAIGDWLVYGEHQFGEKYAQAEHETGYSVETLKRDFWVASRFPKDVRHDDLSFSHHVAVASLPPDCRVTLLAKASENGLSSRELRETVKVYKEAEKPPLPEIDQPHGGFSARTEVSVLQPATVSADKRYAYHLWENYHDWNDPGGVDIAVCAGCGRTPPPRPSNDGTSLVRLNREEVDERGDPTGPAVEVNYCLRCLFGLALLQGKGLEVFGA